MTNCEKLKGKIVENGLTQKQLAGMLGITIATFNYKVNNKSEFKASEIKKLASVLHLTDEEVNAILLLTNQNNILHILPVKNRIKIERMKTMKKFELTAESKINWFGHTLFRIKACIDFTIKGEKPTPSGVGWIARF